MPGSTLIERKRLLNEIAHYLGFEDWPTYIKWWHGAYFGVYELPPNYDFWEQFGGPFQQRSVYGP